MRSLALPLAALLCACGGTPAPEPAPAAPEPKPVPTATTAPEETPEVEAPTERPPRPEADVARDADRKPQEILDFFGIAEGQTVVELMAGRGYYAELLSARVGPKGTVYAHNSPFVLKRFAEQPITERLARPGMENVKRLDTPLDAPEIPAGVDAVLIVLFYHDTFWQEVDRKKMNAAVFAALKPGGVYGVVDHHAEAGSGDRDVKSLHRVDAELVKKEVLEAGFELEAESELLRRPDDDRKTNVFKMRGQTDRFVMRFRKPG